MIWEHTNYRSFLKSVLADRISRNRRYSLRAMAGQLEIAQSTLCDVLKGNKKLSTETAARIARRLELGESESEYFFLLVQFESTADPAFKDTLLRRARMLNPGIAHHDLSVDAFKVIADWQHMAIYEFFEAAPEGFEPSEAARRLGIKTVEAEAALERLKRLELVDQDPGTGRYSRVQGPFLAVSAIPNEALRSFHRQMLQKAIETLETQSTSEKAIGTETFAFDPSQLEEAKRIQEECFQKMSALAAKGKARREVYHLGIQFFRITEPHSSTPRRKP
ncbi:MAG TPA: TIGR02147 family protein [Bdellovibrionota bacterium]|nr:TIGR02147 family protein [Bdellovibrionota bacterium]